MNVARAMLLLLTLASGVCVAGETAAEIESLLTAIGASDCTFVRNGKRYPSADAEAHLRMKYRRGKRYATTAEAFIDRLASRSSFSGKRYAIECPGEPAVPTHDWLMQRLEEHRSAQP